MKGKLFILVVVLSAIFVIATASSIILLGAFFLRWLINF